MGSLPADVAPSFKVSSLPQENGKKTNFGAIVDGLDLKNISGKSRALA
jgi:hypothetical protein